MVEYGIGVIVAKKQIILVQQEAHKKGKECKRDSINQGMACVPFARCSGAASPTWYRPHTCLTRNIRKRTNTLRQRRDDRNTSGLPKSQPFIPTTLHAIVFYFPSFPLDFVSYVFFVSFLQLVLRKQHTTVLIYSCCSDSCVTYVTSTFFVDRLNQNTNLARNGQAW